MAKENPNNGGWICLHRAMKDWQHYGEPSVLVTFLNLLLSVNHEDGWFNGHKCERGATFMGIRAMCQDTSLSQHTIINALKTLEQTGEIKRIKIDQKHTKTIIIKYNDYQSIDLFSGAKEQRKLQRRVQRKLQRNNNNNNNNNIVDDDNIARVRAHEDLVAELMASEILIEGFCKSEQLTKDQLKQLAEAVVTDWELTDEPKASRTKRHLINQIRTKAQAMRDQGRLLTTTSEERKAKFLSECKALIAKGCPKDDVAEFASYYTQPTPDGRMLFETYRGWKTETRFLINQKRMRQ